MEGQRFLAWHMLKPHAGKKFVSLADFMALGDKAKPKTGLDVNTAMRRWMAVVNVAMARRPKTPR